jgi:hypothetical protein
MDLNPKVDSIRPRLIKEHEHFFMPLDGWFILQLWQTDRGYMIRETAYSRDGNKQWEEEFDADSIEDFHEFVRKETAHLRQLATPKGQAKWRTAEDHQKKRKAQALKR